MTADPKPIRRVITGNDALGRSCVLYDSAAPNVNPGAISRGTCMTDIWVYDSAPAIISGTRDDGNLPFHFKPLGPTRLRPDGVWDRGGSNFFSSPVHKSATVDYGILLEGERTLLLDRGAVVMKAATWWCNS